MPFGCCKDTYNFLCNSPENAIDKEILCSRLKGHWVRIQYIVFNILALLVLYIFNDSILRVCIDNNRVYTNIIYHLLQIISIIMYFITSLKNPGYIELSDTKYDINNIKKLKSNSFQSIGNIHNDEQVNLTSDSDRINNSGNNDTSINIDNNTVDFDEISLFKHIKIVIKILKNEDYFSENNKHPSFFCWRCEFLRPLRSKHCWECDRCVTVFDHHCPLIGNCIGYYNHHYFLIFLTFQFILLTWTLIISFDLLFEVKKVFTNTSRSGLDWFIRIIFFIAILFIFFVVLGLFVFHSYLCATNQTTYELIKPLNIKKHLRDKKRLIDRIRKDIDPNIIESEIDVDSDLNNNNIFINGDNLSDNDELNEDNTDDNDNLYQYNTSFNYGFLKNIKTFFIDNINPEWKYPIKCRVQHENISDTE